MVAAYKVPLLEEAVGRLLITVASVILANLMLGENVVPEFLQRDCTPERLAAALAAAPGRYARSAAARSRPSPGSMRIMDIGQAAPSDRAAAWCWIAPRALTNRSARPWPPRPPKE